ncbi:hypothetical protein CORC01_00155 [Colletotrichum orchidophilum]|uniref:Uncharacterized protein n=1 Tax=Colletotrichum orchidophilum TaxID=1209926 RepID=A0A1G4BTE3_9PEZI|nr:uncharacterized protein CORC01_00155 [Colletotrichum orchidophilum]OHF04684.1 hypothetical protein CORC01_00155 [Colletotrichum orchidophilum]
MSATRPSSSRAPVRTTCTSSREIGVLASTNQRHIGSKSVPGHLSALVSVAPRPISPVSSLASCRSKKPEREPPPPFLLCSLYLVPSKVKASKKRGKTHLSERHVCPFRGYGPNLLVIHPSICCLA